ncbi:MAG: TIGR03617 family F420-dependent LLM class oxidoreductase [Acidimicrobiales bacterium]|nr:TIGR03617 family F420-dependent LLM class oxidoreductase [Acidimicrobiales bacterium]
MAPPVVVAAGPTVSYEHPMQLDTVLDADLDGIADQAAQLAAAGFDGAFTFEGPRDVFLPLVPATSAGLQLYTNVAIALPRSPMHLAYTAWDLQRASHGRFALGVGSQIKPHIERRYSALWDKPVAQMRELIQALRAIFDCFQNGSPLDFRGDYYTHTLMIPTHNPGPLEWGPPPIWAAALGPAMTRMVAAEADGIVIHPFNTSHFLREVTVPLVHEGWERAGRTGDGFTFGVGTIIGVYRNDEERAEAERGVRFNLGFYGSTPAYRVVLDAHGWGDVQPELRRLTKDGGAWDRLGAVWTDEQLDALCVLGTPSEVAAELRRRFAGIADRLALSIPHRTSPELLAELGAAWRASVS